MVWKFLAPVISSSFSTALWTAVSVCSSISAWASSPKYQVWDVLVGKEPTLQSGFIAELEARCDCCPYVQAEVLPLGVWIRGVSGVGFASRGIPVLAGR